MKFVMVALLGPCISSYI